MPSGTKMDLTVTTNTGGNNYKIITFMTEEAIDSEIFGPSRCVTPSPNDLAVLTAINDFDEQITVKIRRAEIQGYMLAPFHQRVQTVPAQMAPPNLSGRRQ